MTALPPPFDFAGAVTAGGRSSRFGSDKALAMLEGQPLLHHVAASLDGCQLRLLVAPPGRYTLPNWRDVPDTRPGEGPLAALEAVLIVVREEWGAGWVALAGVDMPRLTPGYWGTLAAARTPESQAVLALDETERPQPLAALYHTELLPHVTAVLNAGERRLRAAADPTRTVFVSHAVIQSAAPDALRNVNTPADLAVLASTSAYKQ
ncbi:molybdenum cofactor guanylyltransferase [Deinococcus sp. YIM 134068]|uniref:molybdenum cofactor guanylyltransferase n=1 Tax=Deinococcus lichenicola TaxID=3118910 RepID=UPI002F9376E3